MDTIAFQIGGLTIYWYGVFAAAGFLAAFWTASRRSLRAGLSQETILDLAPWLIVGAIIGARALYVFSYWNEHFAGKPFWEVFMLRQGGLVYYGGLIGASLAMMLHTRAKRLPLWKLADVLAPSIALGHAFGRIGCLMNGCCYGHPTHLPWAIHFPAGHETLGTGVHPTQIYEASLNLGLYAGLAWWFPRRRFDGQIFAGYLIGYALLRVIVELFRGDYRVHYLGGIATPAQLVSAGILLAGVLLFWRRSHLHPPAGASKT